MAQKKPVTMSAVGGRETYRYAASSYRAKSNEEELFELVQLSEIPLDKELFRVILELLKLNIAPTAILQIIKTMRSQATQSSLPPSLHSSRTHSPVSTSSQHTDIVQPTQRVTQHDSDQRHITTSDQSATPLMTFDTIPVKSKKSTGGHDLHVPGTKSSERVGSGARPTGGERHVKSQSSKQSRTGKHRTSVQTK